MIFLLSLITQALHEITLVSFGGHGLSVFKQPMA